MSQLHVPEWKIRTVVLQGKLRASLAEWQRVVTKHQNSSYRNYTSCMYQKDQKLLLSYKSYIRKKYSYPSTTKEFLNSTRAMATCTRKTNNSYAGMIKIFPYDCVLDQPKGLPIIVTSSKKTKKLPILVHQSFVRKTKTINCAIALPGRLKIFLPKRCVLGQPKSSHNNCNMQRENTIAPTLEQNNFLLPQHYHYATSI